MLQVFYAAAIVAITTAIPADICTNYPFLYTQCLPPKDWICDALPKDYIEVSPDLLKQELAANSDKFNYLQTCNECIGEPKKHDLIADYRKTPVCREVKVPVEHVYRTIRHPVTNVELGKEVCLVVLNNPPNGKSIQKVYKTECYNGNPKNKDNYCRFDYGTFKEYFCRPTNLVRRTMLVYCPSEKGQLRYMEVKIPTACSCVKVTCATPSIPA